MVESQKLLDKSKAIDDIWYLKGVLEEVHPNLYFNQSEEQFLACLSELIDKLPTQVTSDSLSQLLSPIINNFYDGHTGIWSSPKKKNVIADSYFPLKVDLSSYTVCCDNKLGVEPGSKIISINGKDIDEIVKTMLPYVTGEKEYYKLAKLEFELPIYLWEVYGMQGDFELQYSYEGIIYNRVIKGKQSKTFYKKYDGIEAEFTIINEEDSQYAYLNLSMFGYSKDYLKFFEECFTTIKANEIDKLIIDIRDNPGGNTFVSNQLLQYISQKDYISYQSILVKYSKSSRHFYRQYALKKTYLYPFVMMSKIGWKADGIIEKQGIQNKITLEDDLRFNGQVFLITSNYCYSTADDFSRAFKYNKMGTIIGEETGGMRDSYGDCIIFKLPNSKIECGCSSKYFKGLYLGDTFMDGVKPDYYLKCKYATKNDIVIFIDEKFKRIKQHL
ncbi:S41 family peptidase [Saccharicrinis aurantiacus]|uniref:S41 family peptidase n=1 Tax=Saccharicrinis aurantiacus TaxID=1849719 RepID=UPI0024922760|nr:S41 family peptidase [Saccharicrinis aurantiacus]